LLCSCASHISLLMKPWHLWRKLTPPPRSVLTTIPKILQSVAAGFFSFNAPPQVTHCGTLFPPKLSLSPFFYFELRLLVSSSPKELPAERQHVFEFSPICFLKPHTRFDYVFDHKLDTPPPPNPRPSPTPLVLFLFTGQFYSVLSFLPARSLSIDAFSIGLLFLFGLRLSSVSRPQCLPPFFCAFFFLPQYRYLNSLLRQTPFPFSPMMFSRFPASRLDLILLANACLFPPAFPCDCFSVSVPCANKWQHTR